MDRMKNPDLSKKRQSTMIVIKLFIRVMPNNTPEIMTNNKDTVKNKKKCIEKGKWYYEENKNRVWKMTCDWHRGLSEDQKDKKRVYVKNRLQNICEEDRQKLKQRKKYRIREISRSLINFWNLVISKSKRRSFYSSKTAF